MGGESSLTIAQQTVEPSGLLIQESADGKLTGYLLESSNGPIDGELEGIVLDGQFSHAVLPDARSLAAKDVQFHLNNDQPNFRKRSLLSSLLSSVFHIVSLNGPLSN